MTASEPLLVAESVSRAFGHRQAVRDASFQVQAGDVLMFMGHNGAGKTTMIRLLAGLLKPNAGSIHRSGTISLVAHHSMLYESLSGKENLSFFAKLNGVRNTKRESSILVRVGLEEHADRRVREYSRGMIQRLAIARSLISDPDILLLDEPLTGLDEAAAGITCDLISELKEKRKAVVVATHQVVELSALSTSVGFLIEGKLVAVEQRNGRNGAMLQERYRELSNDG